MWLLIGILLFVSWDKLLQGLIESHRTFWGRLGIPLGSERIPRVFLRAVVTVLSLACLLAGSGNLYKFSTGRDWFLRNAQWTDLWPFLSDIAAKISF
jgi:hypothetical protein